jgi:hypothetical protein
MPSLTSTISSFPTSTILSPRPDTQPPLPIPTPPPPPTTPSRLEHQSTHIAAGPMGTAIVLLFVDAILRYRPPIPLPSRDTSLNYQHSSRWALGTSYCRPVADIRPPTLTPSSESRQEHQPPHIAAGPWEQPLSCSSPTPASFRPIRPTRHHDTGFKHDRASAGPWELHASACRRPTQHPIDQKRTPNPTTPSLPQPLLPTSKLTA